MSTWRMARGGAGTYGLYPHVKRRRLRRVVCVLGRENRAKKRTRRERRRFTGDRMLSRCRLGGCRRSADDGRRRWSNPTRTRDVDDHPFARVARAVDCADRDGGGAFGRHLVDVPGDDGELPGVTELRLDGPEEHVAPSTARSCGAQLDRRGITTADELRGWFRGWLLVEPLAWR